MQRASNIELLRIISILMILAHHVLVHGIADSINSTTMHLLDAFVIYGVNIFLLISGYFTIKLKWKSILNLFWICCFWKFFHLSYETFIEGVPHSLFEWIAKPLAIPFSSGGWFVDIYIMLMLVSPILNIALERMSKKELNTSILLMTIFNIIYCWMLGKENNTSGYSLYHFIYVYSIGFYIKESDISFRFKKTSVLACSLLTFILYETIGAKAFSYNSPPVIMGGILIFLIVNKLHIKSNLTNQLAQSVLSIYLATDGGLFAHKIYNNYNEALLSSSNTLTAIMQITGIALGVCLFVILLDRLRIILFIKVINPISELVLNNYRRK